MFFTRIGKVIAHLIFWFGLIRVAIALAIAFGTSDMESNAAFSRRYLSTDTSGAALSNTLLLGIAAAVALGVLCEISAKLIKADVAP